MRVLSLGEKLPLQGGVVATLGSFDGLHRGHQAVLNIVMDEAKKRNLPSAVISFYPHPSVALGKIKTIPLITTFRQRAKILLEIGIDYFILIRFSKELCTHTWQEFCEKYLLDQLRVKELIIGPDARVGRGAEGTAALLEKFLPAKGCNVIILPFVNDDNVSTKVASRAIREAVSAGEVEKASKLLGRNFVLEGKVIHGDGRGRTIGVPTANLLIRKQLLPKDGVYCGFVTFEERKIPAVCNVGLRPTFNKTARQVEVHCLSPVGDLYGKRLSLSFLYRLRDEMKFSDISSLKSQIALDIEQAAELLIQKS